jgi:hypothetical protein
MNFGLAWLGRVSRVFLCIMTGIIQFTLRGTMDVVKML